MSTSQTRARSEVVMVRLTPDEKARFAQLAALHRLTLPAFFRLAAETVEFQEAIRG